MISGPKIFQMINLIKEKIVTIQNFDKFVDKKHTIINQIHTLNDSKHIEILHKRYVEFKSFELIAVEMSYTYQYIRELHGNALRKFETSYKNLHSDVL